MKTSPAARAVAGVTLALQLVALTHLLVAVHGTCPLDGDIVDVLPAPEAARSPTAPTGSPGGALAGPTADRLNHAKEGVALGQSKSDADACATALALFEASAVVGQQTATSHPVGVIAQTGRASFSRPRLTGPPLWRLAPKQGPPT